MRPAVVLALCSLAACDLYFQQDKTTKPVPPTCDGPAPSDNCVCTDTIGWACNTCPFGEGSAPVACDQPGTGCSLETWEHGCDCSCDSDGWWACTPETIGSQCPSPPPPPPNVCATIEAEGLAGHDGWGVAFGADLHGGEALSANASDAALPVAFTGTGLILYVETGPGMGTYSVSVDDSFVVDIDANQPGEFAFQVPEVVASGLPSGSHVATISCSALPCEVDYFDVTCM